MAGQARQASQRHLRQSKKYVTAERVPGTGHYHYP
uniref:Uncharacterized protein n=1 Tax=Ralstonia syzygii R24 TaxID=907261 RepID=G3A8D8_9RALS|nr:hypothetical protein RALSY_mp10027 [Ralstonia syzygii R24]